MELQMYSDDSSALIFAGMGNINFMKAFVLLYFASTSQREQQVLQIKKGCFHAYYRFSADILVMAVLMWQYVILCQILPFASDNKH